MDILGRQKQSTYTEPQLQVMQCHVQLTSQWFFCFHWSHKLYIFPSSESPYKSTSQGVAATAESGSTACWIQEPNLVWHDKDDIWKRFWNVDFPTVTKQTKKQHDWHGHQRAEGPAETTTGTKVKKQFRYINVFHGISGDDGFNYLRLRAAHASWQQLLAHLWAVLLQSSVQVSSQTSGRIRVQPFLSNKQESTRVKVAHSSFSLRSSTLPVQKNPKAETTTAGTVVSVWKNKKSPAPPTPPQPPLPEATKTYKNHQTAWRKKHESGFLLNWINLFKTFVYSVHHSPHGLCMQPTAELRSIDHVRTSNERYHPSPPHPILQNKLKRALRRTNMCENATCANVCREDSEGKHPAVCGTGANPWTCTALLQESAMCCSRETIAMFKVIWLSWGLEKSGRIY